MYKVETCIFVPMERRIKLIWMLSIGCMLLLIGGQGYWLLNQYRYTNEAYAEEVRRRVGEAIAANDSLRNYQTEQQKEKNVFWYSFNTNMDMVTDSLTGQTETRVNIIVRSGRRQPDGGYSEDDALTVDSICLPGEKPLYDLSLVNKHVLELCEPFRLAQFDSLLSVRLSGTHFTTRLTTTEADTVYQFEPVVSRGGTLFRSTVSVLWPYNPLKRQLVQVEVIVPGSMLLLRMGGQLVGSVLLIALLGVCLLFQIKTILKQHKVDELRRSFTNTMIHELKRPVQTLKMCLAFLGDSRLRADEQETSRVLADSMQEADNLSAYLQKLRDMTRTDDERIPLTLRPFDLCPVVEKLIRLQHIPDDKLVTFETHFDPAPMSVTADPMHLSNILSNLLENAVKYSGPSVHIVVTCILSPHRLTVRVADNGMGIPSAEQSRVFDKFYRSVSLSVRDIPGIGLGLSYVKLLTEAHHGTVTLRSQPGKGTEVTVEIPQ